MRLRRFKKYALGAGGMLVLVMAILLVPLPSYFAHA
jgi:hypothetical protein